MIKIFRIVSYAEGLSLLTLLFIAMPLKYFMDMPETVKVAGWIHGILFIAYVVILIAVQVSRRWSLLFFVGAFVASLVPFGTFVLDKHLQRKEANRSVLD